MPATKTTPANPVTRTEIRVHGTPTSLILHNFGSTLQQAEVLDILFQGQSAVVDGLVASKGNAPIERLAFVLWSGNLGIRVQPGRRKQTKWLMLAQTFMGILQFMEDFEWMEVKISVLDLDEVESVGTGMLLYGGRPRGFDGSLMVETE